MKYLIVTALTLSVLSLASFAKPKDLNVQAKPVERLERTEKTKAVKHTKPKQKAPRVAEVQRQAKPKPVVKVYPKGCERYRPLISKYDWNVATMIAIAAAESGCDPNAINHTDNHGVCMGSAGLFQISCHAGLITDPAKNIAAAFGKYKSQGYAAWSVCTNGRVVCL